MYNDHTKCKTLAFDSCLNLLHSNVKDNHYRTNHFLNKWIRLKNIFKLKSASKGIERTKFIAIRAHFKTKNRITIELEHNLHIFNILYSPQVQNFKPSVWYRVDKILTIF